MKKQVIGKCPCCESLLMVRRGKEGNIEFVKLESSKTKDIIQKRDE